MDEPRHKLIEATYLRWLSHFSAIKAFIMCYGVLILFFEEEAVEFKDDTAQGMKQARDCSNNFLPPHLM